MSTPAATAAPREDEGRLVQIKHWLRRRVQTALAPLVREMARRGIGPNLLSVIGCIMSLVAALAFFEGGFRLGSLFLLLAGLCDILDGQLARELGIESKFGSFLDSTLDRLGEGLVMAGISGFYMEHLLELVHDPSMVFAELQWDLEPGTWARLSLISVLALVGGFLVSYTRARAEGLGLECRVGWAERPERLAVLIVAGAFGISRVMPAALLLLTILSFATAAQRVAFVWKATRVAKNADPGGDR